MKVIPKTLPPLVYMIGINKSQALQLAAFGTMLLFLAGGIFAYLTGAESGTGGFSPVLSLLVYTVALVAHEAVHGLFFWVFGGRPKYGVGLMYYFFPYAYATAHGQPYTFRQMIVIGMSPFVLICAAALAVALIFPATTPYAAVAFVGNFAGAIGDMWLMRQMLRFRRMKQLMLVDLKNGLAVHTRDPRAKMIVARLEAHAAGASARDRFMKVWGAAFATLVLASAALPTLLDLVGYRGYLVIGPAAFPLFEVNLLTDNFSFAFNPIGAAIAALFFALLYTLLVRQSKK